MVALLYFWSGVSKLRGHFFIWVYHYQFLTMSPIAYPLRRLFLTEGGLPRLWSVALGLAGAAAEAVIGILLLLPDLQVVGTVCATAMHLFIFVCGMGPYRWNLMQVYLCWNLMHTNLQPHAWIQSWTTVLYVTLTSVVVPMVGLVDYSFLGRWLGGYRMATFHFAGNDEGNGFFIRVNAIKAYLDHHARDGSTTAITGLMGRLAGAHTGLQHCDQFWEFSHCTDGFNPAITVQPAATLSSAADANEFSREFTFVSLAAIGAWGWLLTTKFDETLSSVTTRYTELLQDELRPFCREGDALLLTVKPLRHFLATKRTWHLASLFEGDSATTCSSSSRFTGHRRALHLGDVVSW